MKVTESSTAKIIIIKSKIKTCICSNIMLKDIKSNFPLFCFFNQNTSPHLVGVVWQSTNGNIGMYVCVSCTAHQVCVVSRDGEAAGAWCRSGNLPALLLCLTPADFKQNVLSSGLIFSHFLLSILLICVSFRLSSVSFSPVSRVTRKTT